MAITLKVAVPNLLPAVITLLIHPRLCRVRELPPGADPVQVFAFVGALVARAVVETVVGGGEAVSPFLGVVGEVGIPD